MVLKTNEPDFTAQLIVLINPKLMKIEYAILFCYAVVEVFH